LWYKYANKVVGTDEFGFSASGGAVMDAFGINVENLLAVAEAMLQEGREEARARKRQTSRLSSKTSITQSAIWSKFDCETLDTLPGKSGTLESLSELSDDYSSVADSVSESAGESFKQKMGDSD